MCHHAGLLAGMVVPLNAQDKHYHNPRRRCMQRLRGNWPNLTRRAKPDHNKAGVQVVQAARRQEVSPVETPLSPLEFMRRSRRLYPNREAVVDGDLRLTYEQFCDRCDRWSSAL